MEADPSNEEGPDGVAPAGPSQPLLPASRPPLPIAAIPGGQLPAAAPDAQPAPPPAASTGARTGSGADGAVPRSRASSISPSRLGPQLALRPIWQPGTSDGSAHAPTQRLQTVVRIPAAGHVSVLGISRGELAAEAADPGLRFPAGLPPDAAAATAAESAAAAAGPSATFSQPPLGLHASASPAPRLSLAAPGLHGSQDVAARRAAQRAAGGGAGFFHAAAALGPLQQQPQPQHVPPLHEQGFNPAAGFLGGGGPVRRQDPPVEGQQAEDGDGIDGAGAGGGDNLNAAGTEPETVPDSIDVTVAVKAPGGGRRGGDVFVRGGYMRGTHVGKFDVERYKADRYCIQYNGKWMSRSHFEKVGGSRMAKWYRSIRVYEDLEPLGEWLVRHGLEIQKGPARRSSKRQAVDSGDEQQPQPPPPQRPLPPRGPAVPGTSASTPSAQPSAEALNFPDEPLPATAPVLAVAAVRTQPHGLSDPLPDPLLEALAAGGSGAGVGSPSGGSGAGAGGGGVGSSGPRRAFLQRLLNTLPRSSLPTAAQADLEPSARAAAGGPGPGPPAAGFGGWDADRIWGAAAAAAQAQAQAQAQAPLGTDTGMLAPALQQSGDDTLSLPPGTEMLPMLQWRHVLQPAPPELYPAGPDDALPLAPPPFPPRLPAVALTTPSQQLLTQRFARPPTQEPQGEPPSSPPPRPPPPPQLLYQQQQQQQPLGDVEMEDLRSGLDTWGPAAATAAATTAAAVPDAPLLHPARLAGLLPHAPGSRRLRTEAAGPGEVPERGHRLTWYQGGPEPSQHQQPQPAPEQDSTAGPDEDMEDVGRGHIPPGELPIGLAPWQGLIPFAGLPHTRDSVLRAAAAVVAAATEQRPLQSLQQQWQQDQQQYHHQQRQHQQHRRQQPPQHQQEQQQRGHQQQEEQQRQEQPLHWRRRALAAIRDEDAREPPLMSSTEPRLRPPPPPLHTPQQHHPAPPHIGPQLHAPPHATSLTLDLPPPPSASRVDFELHSTQQRMARRLAAPHYTQQQQQQQQQAPQQQQQRVQREQLQQQRQWRRFRDETRDGEEEQDDDDDAE